MALSREQIHLLRKSIDQILWEDWDPIGINDTPEARDEYHMYVPEVFRLVVTNSDCETIALHLQKIVRERMELHIDLDKCRSVATKVLGVNPANT